MIHTVYFLIFIAITVFFAHGVVFFNDGMYGDGMLLYRLLQPARIHHFITLSRQGGRMLLGHVFMATARIKNKIFVYRLVGVLAVVIITWITYFICLECGQIDTRVALAVALLVATYTGNQMIMVSPVVFYYLFHALFLLGILIGLHAMHSTGWTQGILYVASVVFLVLSFQIDSHLAYLCAFSLLLLLKHFHWAGQETFGQLSTILTAVAYGLLPVVYWVLKNIRAPRHGPYKEYYRVRLHPELTRKYAVRVFTWGVLGALLEPFRYTLRLQWGWLVLFPATVAGWLFHRLEIVAPPPTPEWCAGFIVAGATLLVLGNIPYVLVLQPAGLRGWATKNNMLIGLPTAALLVGTLGLVLADRWFSAALGFAMTFFVVYLGLLHIYWVAIWAKHRSFLHNLVRIPGARDTSIFGFCDKHPVSMSFDGHREHYPLYVISMLDWLWGDLSRLVAVEPKERHTGYTPAEIEAVIQATTMEYILTALDKGGPQASIVLGQGVLRLSPTEAGLRYIWHRYLNRKGLDSFLSEFTSVRFASLPAPPPSQAERLCS